MYSQTSRRYFLLVGLCAVLSILGVPRAGAEGGPWNATAGQGYAETFGLSHNPTKMTFGVQYVGCTLPTNVLWPGEQTAFTFQVYNQQPDTSLSVKGRVVLLQYAMQGIPNDIWTPQFEKLADLQSVPVTINIAAKGFAEYTVKPTVPARFGGYALLLDLGPRGRQPITFFVRTFKSDRVKPLQYPQLCLDNSDPALLLRLNAAPNRMGFGYKATTDPDFEAWYESQIRQPLLKYQAAGLGITLEIGAGGPQPFGPAYWCRPQLTDKGVWTTPGYPGDGAWLPSADEDFKKFCKRLALEFGWPRGPMNGLKLWNEPWNGGSIAAWGADDLRYREMYTKMCEGVEEARKEGGVQVLLGGCDSSSNTLDKLFCDGSDAFLKRLDFVSMHYQGLSPASTVRMWVDRKEPYGRVLQWDTESWVANTDDRVSAVVATNLSSGHDRAVGISHAAVATDSYIGNTQIRNARGESVAHHVTHVSSLGASIGAVNHFIGLRKFRKMLFTNGLPWVSVFDGRKNDAGVADPEDGTVVIVGDIGDVFNANILLFRNARGFAEIQGKKALNAQLAALPAEAPAETRAALRKKLDTPWTLQGGRLSVRDPLHHFRLFDFYGNEMPSSNGMHIVPLDQRGFYLRGNGTPGSFAALLTAVRSARLDGIEPLQKECLDFTERIENKPLLRLRLTNVLNRPIAGQLRVAVEGLTLERTPRAVAFGPEETKVVTFKVLDGKTVLSNLYPLTLRYDAGVDGVSEFAETLHVNLIARRTITVDGKLDDWEGVPGQAVVSPVSGGPTLTEAAWWPYRPAAQAGGKGAATAWLAYDQQYLYFAAKVQDTTPDAGMPRFAIRDEDADFYPPVCTTMDGKTLTWPEGVRRYTYRRWPELPGGSGHDNIQIAFNVLPADEKWKYPCPPGTMPGYIAYADTDYEYALNPVAPQYGDGTEIWMLKRPGFPHKHFYPRSPKAPGEGPVQDGQLVITRDGTTRITECALPWREIPEVKKALDAGRTIKFSYRVNDNAGIGCTELARGRSVSKLNDNAFSVDWEEHWANELAFAFEGAGQ